MSEHDEGDSGDDDAEPSEDKSLLGALSLIGLLSFCCIGLGAVAGGVAVAGGAAGTTAAIGGADARGTLISVVVTGLTVAAVALVVRWQQG